MVEMASKCTIDAENVYAPLVMVSIVARKRTLAGKTVYINGSLDTSLDPPPFSLVGSTVKETSEYLKIAPNNCTNTTPVL